MQLPSAAFVGEGTDGVIARHKSEIFSDGMA
jgi:hypothetical protein